MYDYEEMSREELVNHVRAYSDSLHKTVSELTGYRFLFGPLPQAYCRVSQRVFAEGREVLRTPAER
jgi:hypothetical protein